MNCSMPGLPVHHQFLEFAQTHVPWVGDAIQTSHPLSSTSPAFGLSQQKGLFKWVRLFAVGGQSIGISASASIPPMNIQDWFPLRWTHWISLQSKGPSHHSSKASILWCSAFFTVQLSHPYTTTGKTTHNFKGYSPFIVIIKYWLYSPYYAIYPRSLFYIQYFVGLHPLPQSCSPVPSLHWKPLVWRTTALD